MRRFLPKRREPFGKAGLTVATVALVMALIGGAYAAGGLTKSQEKQVTKIAKKYAGKPGATGAAGTNGTNGKDGAAGAAGTAGTSVTVSESESAIEGHCNGTTSGGLGGSKFVAGTTKTYACNGKEGSPWTAGGTLPKGASESGTWAVSGTPVNYFNGSFHGLLAPISFGIALPAPLNNEVNCDQPGEPVCVAHLIGPEEGEGEPKEATAIQEGECTGTFMEPGAGEGHFCIFVTVGLAVPQNLKEVTISKTFNLLEPNGSGASVHGSVLFVKAPDTNPMLVSGTWAVTSAG